MTNTKVNEWNKSYENKNNFVFYPDEEIIRFISKYIRKRIGVDEYVDQADYQVTPKVLDFGCGIGRHVKLVDEFNLDVRGFDLSKEAINVARATFNKLGLDDLIDKVMVADITDLPYGNNEFDYMLSHGVLDSMPFNIAKKGMSELHRCMKLRGKMYFDLISDKDSSFNEGDLEQVVMTEHEQGTIQSYFNKERIEELIEGLFKVTEIKLKTNVNVISGLQHCRYYVVVEKY